MNVYEMLDKTINSKEFFEYLSNLKIFCELAQNEKDKNTIINNFYERMLRSGLISYIFDNREKKYVIYKDERAMRSFMALTLPAKESPVKSLKNLEKSISIFEKNYCPSNGKQITEESILKIMNYMDDEYDFSRKIFKDKKAMFLIMDVGNVKLDAECDVIPIDNKIIIHFLLYRLTAETSEVMVPEAVLFHELGHAVYERAFGNMSNVPLDYLQILKETVFPEIFGMTSAEQNEVFADVLSIGMMYDSPFSEFDPFNDKYGSKKAYKELFNTIMKEI